MENSNIARSTLDANCLSILLSNYLDFLMSLAKASKNRRVATEEYVMRDEEVATQFKPTTNVYEATRYLTRSIEYPHLLAPLGMNVKAADNEQRLEFLHWILQHGGCLGAINFHDLTTRTKSSLMKQVRVLCKDELSKVPVKCCVDSVMAGYGTRKFETKTAKGKSVYFLSPSLQGSLYAAKYGASYWEFFDDGRLVNLKVQGKPQGYVDVGTARCEKCNKITAVCKDLDACPCGSNENCKKSTNISNKLKLDMANNPGVDGVDVQLFCAQKHLMPDLSFKSFVAGRRSKSKELEHYKRVYDDIKDALAGEQICKRKKD